MSTVPAPPGDPSPGRRLRDLMAQTTLAVPGAFNAGVARLAERVGFAAVYVSGAGLANGVAGVPDVGLLTLTEVVTQARYIVEAVSVPVIVDADTGFGEVVNLWRTVREFERAGVAAIHIEDQENPKRCGHLAGKRLLPPEEMARRLAAAVAARQDPDFVLIARVDSRAVHGLADAVERARLYRTAGADVIFAEGLESVEEFATFAQSIPGPLMANMTEFGRTPLLPVAEFARLGYRIVLFPMTAFRVMMKAVEVALVELRDTGTQRGLLNRMQTREDLYDLVGYAEFAQLDERIAGYRVESSSPQPDRQAPEEESRDHS